jgi:glucose-6-phosphate isomerase
LALPYDFLCGFLRGTWQAHYERAVGLYASLVTINAYHQPGVEAGKKAASAILELQSKVIQALHDAAGPLDLEALARAAEAAEQVETVHQIVRHLAANRRGVSISGDQARPASLMVFLKQLVPLS